MNQSDVRYRARGSTQPPRAGGSEPRASASRGFGYLPSLDGIRALSLIGILLYHSDFTWARGGYLGVTVFFTLSGFLIASLLLRERDLTGGIRLGAFWRRRARRLGPPVLGLLALVAVLSAAGVLSSAETLAGDAIATSTWMANWWFIISGQTYAGFFGEPSPFQHMWSLAVEEQFYLLLPVSVLVLLGRRGRARRWRLALVVTAGTALSTLLAALLFTETETLRSYFGTDTRMAEPLVGVLLALLLVGADGPRRLGPVSGRALGATALVAVAALATLMYGLGRYDARLYHGGLLITAVLAAVLVAAATQPRALVSRTLALPPLAALGRISYGAYVYHWPIFMWLTGERTGLSPGPLFMLRVGATLVLAALSYQLLEQPIRAGVLRPRIGIAGLATATAAALAITVVGAGLPAPSVGGLYGDDAEAPAPPPPVPTAGARPAAAPSTAKSGGVRDGPAEGARTRSASSGTKARGDPGSSARRAADPPEDDPLRVAILGDSLANNLAGGMNAWADKRSDVVIYNVAMPGCPIAPGGTWRFPDGYTKDVKPHCAWWQDPGSDRSAKLATFDPDVIVIQDSRNEMPDRKQPDWTTYFGPGAGVYDTWLINQYQHAIETFTRNQHTEVVLLNAVCADWARLQGWSADGDPQRRVNALNVDYRALTATNYTLKDLNAILCPDGRFTNTVAGVQNARPDGYHLSEPAALAVARKWLGPIVFQAGR